MIRNASDVMATVSDIFKNRMVTLANELEMKLGPVPFVQNLKRIAQQEVSGVGNAPYFVVVSETKGTPPVAAQSLSYCLAICG